MIVTFRPAVFRPLAAGRRISWILTLLAGVATLLVLATPSRAALSLTDALAKTGPAALIAAADGLGPVEGAPPVVPIYRGDDVVGYAFLNSDVVSSVGYSGKPIQVLLALDLDGTIRAAKLVEHHEPIVLIGIPERKVVDFIARYVGRNVRDLGVHAGQTRTVDVISGATVTVMVIDDSISRAALKVARARGLGGLRPEPGGLAEPGGRTLDMTRRNVVDWLSLVADGAVRRLVLSVGEISAAFAEADLPRAAARPESDDSDEVFIDLYAALVSAPSIGRSLLGDAEYDLLAARLKPDQHALLIVANGLYSFKGSGYVRGGIFDRFQVVQGDNSVRFKDRHHKRLGEVAAAHAQKFREVALFVIPEGSAFDATRSWRLELLVHRAVGALEKEFLAYDLRYRLPDKYVLPPEQPAAATRAAADVDQSEPAPLWQRIWQDRVVDLAVLAAALSTLTVIFFFQNWFAARPKLATGVRVGFLIFTVAWLGGYAQAQLSVVNVLTFFSALVTGFKWEFFLIDPMIFILWYSVAISRLFWGRGAFCGWLCPFGALQELISRLARAAGVPQLRLPWGLHERLWPLKYMIFVCLLGLSLYSLGLAEQISEVEPFKTSFILRFLRDWPFVLYAGGLLLIGVFIERFFCRYICPLGAALAIPGKLRIFEWLKRHKECGAPCQRCAQDCMVQAIHPDGRINANECLYCLNCQTLYYDDHVCPAMIQRRLRRERRRAMQSSSLAAGKAPMPLAAGPEVRS